MYAIRRNHLLSSTSRFLLVYALAIAAGLMGGFVSATGKIVLVAMFSGLVLAALLMTSRKALLWFVIVGGLVIVGAAQIYMPGSKYLRYIVPLAAFGLIIHGVVDYLSKPAHQGAQGANATVSWMLWFLLVAVVSAVVNWDGIGVAIIGFKGYFQMWALFLGMILIHWRRDIIKTIPQGMLLIAFLQLPFVLHQYLFLVPKRVGLGGGIVPVDVVSGTFGGSLYGGGANAVLAAAVRQCLGQRVS